MQPVKPITEEDLRRCLEHLCLIQNGNVDFGSPDNPNGGTDNINGVWFKGTTPAVANTEFAVLHNLGRVPVGFDVKRMNKAARFYDSGTAWTKTTMYLKCDTITVIYTLFIH